MYNRFVNIDFEKIPTEFNSVETFNNIKIKNI